MFRLLLLLFIVTPLVEFALLYYLALHTSLMFTIAVVILTGFLGAYLAKREGLRTWRRIQDELQQGQMPSSSLLDALMIFVAGALLVTPGVLTDAIGFSLLLPPCRAAYKRLAQRYMRARFNITTATFGSGEYRGSTGRTEVIDSYVVEDREE